MENNINIPRIQDLVSEQRRRVNDMFSPTAREMIHSGDEIYKKQLHRELQERQQILEKENRQRKLREERDQEVAKQRRLLSEENERRLEKLDAEQEKIDRENAEKRSVSDRKYDSAYTGWLKELSKEDGIAGNAAKLVLAGRYAPDGIPTVATNAMMKLFFNIKNMLGDGIYDGTEAHLQELGGKFDYADLKILEGDAHLTMVNAQATLNDLTQLREEYIAQRGGTTSPYDGDIKRMQNVINRPDIKQLDDLYKRRYVIDHYSPFEYVTAIKDYVWDLMRGVTVESALSNSRPSQQTIDWKNQVAQERAAKQQDEYEMRLTSEASKYNAINAALNNENKQLTDNIEKFISQNNTDSSSLFFKTDKSNAAATSININNPDDRLQFEENEVRKNTVLAKAELEELLEEYKNTLLFQQKSEEFFNVAKEYRDAKEAYNSASLLNPYWYFYVLPGIIGSSNSSVSKIKANILQYGGAAVGAVAGSFSGNTVGGATAGYNIGTALSMPLQIVAGFDENYAENGDKRVSQMRSVLSQYKSEDDVINDLAPQVRNYFLRTAAPEELENIKNILKNKYDEKTEEGRNNILRAAILLYPRGEVKNNHPAFNASIFLSTAGLEATRQANNMRTMGEMPVQLALQFLPGDKLLSRVKGFIFNSGGKIAPELRVAATQVGERVAVRDGRAAAARQASNSRYANGFRRNVSAEDAFDNGWNKGGKLGDMLGFGYAGHVVGAVSGAVLNSTARLVRQNLPKSTQVVINKFEEALMNRYAKVYDKLLSNKDWAKLALKYGIRTAERSLESSFSEGAEEGTQYLNSKEDFAKKYGWDTMSIGDMIANDLYKGKDIATAYMSLLGIADSPLLNDAKFWQNVKGGFGMCAAHTGAIHIIGNTKNAIREYQTSQVIANSAVVNREIDKISRASNTVFAEQAMLNRGEEVIATLERMQREDSRRENPEYSQEDYDEKIKDAKTIINLSGNNAVRLILEAKGITYGSTEYATAIADIYNLQKQLLENGQLKAQVGRDLNKLYNSKEFRQEFENVVSSYDTDISVGLTISQQKFNAAEDAVKKEIESAKKLGVDTTTEAFKKRLNDIRKTAMTEKELELRGNIRSNLEYKTRLVRKLHALLKIKALMNTIDDWYNLMSEKLGISVMRPDASTVRKNIEAQTELAKKDLKEFDSSLNIDTNDGEFIRQLNSITDVVNINNEEIEDLEVYSAMIDASNAVSQSYLDIFNEGIVTNKDGKLEYNPAQAKLEREYSDRVLKALKENNKEALEAERKNAPTAEYDAAKVENNPYLRRIRAIQKADDENRKLNWLVNDIYEGDAVTKLQEVLEEERNAQEKENSNPEQDVLQSNEGVKQDLTTKWKRTKEKRTSEFDKARKKYEARKRKAKLAYENRKRKYKNWKRGNLNAEIIPGLQDAIVAASNYLLSKAEQGVYKFEQFVSDIREIAQDVDINDVLPLLKQIYTNSAAKLAFKSTQFVQNLSSPGEIVGYTITQDTNDEQRTVLQKINDASQKIIQTVTTFYDVFVEDENGVSIYKNEAAIDNYEMSLDRDDIRKIYDFLVSKNTSDEEFELAISEVFDGVYESDYIKYRNVDGAVEAIARAAVQKNSSVQDAITVRNAVIEALLGNYSNIENLNGDVAKFKQDVAILKNKIESAGYTIVGLSHYLYGKDNNGNNIASEGDIILSDKDGRLIVVDISQSYKYIGETNFEQKRGVKSKYTIKEEQERKLLNEEQILRNSYGASVIGLRTLFVQYDTLHNMINLVPNMFKIRLTSQEDSSEDLSLIKEAAKKAVDEINNAIENYNTLCREYNGLGGNAETKDSILLTEYDNVEDYQNYLNQLQKTKDDILFESAEIFDKIQDLLENSTILVEGSELEFSPQPKDYLAVLQDFCKQLDTLLQNIPDTKALTEQEKENVYKMYSLLFLAQKALDDFLQSDRTQEYDVSQECELIAGTIEKLAENNENFGGLNIFVRRWWMNDFSNSLNLAQEFVGLSKQISAWLNTLYKRVTDDDLDNRPELQKLYSSLLNNYFSKLLNNAESRIEKLPADETQKLILQRQIQHGRELIESFNLKWGILPENISDIEIVDDLDFLNKISVTWKDLYGPSEWHSPAIDQQTNLKNYWWFSQRPDFAQKVKYNFYKTKSGEVKVYISYYDQELEKERFEDLGFVINETLYPEEVRPRIREINRANKRFTEKISKLLDYRDSHKDKKLKLKVPFKLNKGSIDYGSQPISVLLFLFADPQNKQDLYSITLSEQNHIGILSTIFNRTTLKFRYDVMSGSNLTLPLSDRFDKEFEKQLISINSGAIIYFYDYGDGNRIGVPIESQPIGTTDATRLVYLIEQLFLGNTKIDGYNIEDLLSQRLYLKNDQGKKTTPYNNTNNLVTLNADGTVTIGQDTYDIKTSKGELISRISKLTNVTNGAMLNSTMDDTSDSVMSQVVLKFSVNADLNEITLPNGFVISRDDILRKSTWLGYFMRNNVLLTTAKGKKYRQINFGDPRLEPEDLTLSVPTQLQITNQRTRSRTSLRAELISKLAEKSKRNSGGLAMEVNSDEIDTSRSISDQEKFKQAVISYFEQIFGKQFVEEHTETLFDDNAKDFLGRASDDSVIIGICTSEIIKLSVYAPYTAMYHEAFHRVLELLLPDKQRESLYSAYRKAYGENLSERQVAEGLADLFVSHVEKTLQIKNAKGLSKIKSVFDKLKYIFGMVWKLGVIDSIKMFSLYRDMNRGKFKNKQVDEAHKLRFKNKFGDELYYTVTNPNNPNMKADFEFITNSSDLNEMCKALGYYIIDAIGIDKILDNPKILDTKNASDWLNKIDKELVDVLCGNKEESPYDDQLAFREIFKATSEYIYDEKYYNETGLNRIIGERRRYYNFETISQYVVDYISTIITKQVAQEDLNDDEDEKVYNKNIDKYDKAAYEFSKLSSVSQKVHIFLSTIPYCYLENGKLCLDINRNKYYSPTYIPIGEIYNRLIDDFGGINSIEQLKLALEEKSQQDPVYRYISDEYNKIYNKIYSTDKDGNTVINYDKESFAILLLLAIRSQKIDFMIALSKKSDNGKRVRITSSSLDRDSRRLSTRWSNILQNGQVRIFSVVKTNDGDVQLNPEVKPTVFREIAAFFEEITTKLGTSQQEIDINGEVLNKSSVEDLNYIKQEIIDNLNKIGIIFTKDALDYMLLNKYGSLNADAIYAWLTHRDNNSAINTFLHMLNNIIRGGNIDLQIVKQGYSKIGFVNDLANWQGAYNRVSMQRMALGLNGKKLYNVTLNNTISKITEDLNSADLNNDVVKLLTGFSFNVTKRSGADVGSIILRQILSGKHLDLKIKTYIGFKTDNRNDQGNDYKDSPDVEDYIAKLTMLQNGYLIFPTLADKSTWNFIEGVSIPGLSYVYNNDNTQASVINSPTIEWFNGQYCIRPCDQVLDQMIQYAYCERAAIQECMESLGYDNIPGYEKQGLHVLNDDEKIQNYHTKNEQGVEPSGTRFLSLTQIVVKNNGKIETINLNDPTVSSVKLLETANKEFFDRKENESDEDFIKRQRDIMAHTLITQNRLEIERAIELGIVRRELTTVTKNDGSKLVVSEDDKQSMINLRTNQLDDVQINALAESLMNSMPNWKKLKNSTKYEERVIYMERFELCKSLAIAALLGDATNRSSMSSEEVIRCYCGHMGAFKILYDMERKCIKDSTYDLQKRLGGMISFGDDNMLGLPMQKAYYTCAECKDYKVPSTANAAKRVYNLFEESCVREAYANKIKDYEKAFSCELSEILNDEDEEVRRVVSKAKKDAKKYADTLLNGINVADGAAYITADMCELMLRMRGARDSRTKKALKILTDDSTKYAWVLKQDAYKIIYNNLNIVTTKYTAYGFREHTKGQDKLSSIAVPYYNKFALFPIFPCIATGRMHELYNKMLDEKVDMLLMQSAVKVGSQCSSEFKDGKIDGKFNTYQQSFSFLRRQLNTEPEEGNEGAIGTQMVKVCLQNLRVDRKDYKNITNGANISGQTILSTLMESIKILSEIGVLKILDQFFDKDDGGVLQVNQKKLSNYLKKQLSGKVVNSTTALALQLVDGNMTGVLSSTPDTSWIESVLISTINKAVIDITTPGNSFVQRSVFAVEGKAAPGEGLIQSDLNMSPEINGGNKLQMLNPDGSMDAVISIDYFKSIIPEGLSFEEARQFLIDNGILGKPIAVGYRIPTQAQSSIHALRFVDVIPATQSTIILPEEFTKITGSDFDIDHLYIASYNFVMGTDGKLTSRIRRHNEDGTENEKYHQNTILDMMLTLLMDYTKSFNFLYRSIDNDTDLLKDLAKKIPEQGSSKHIAYNFGTLHEQTSRKNDYITGKKGIAPFALNVTNHVLTTIFGTKFKKTPVSDAIGCTSLAKIMDDNDNYIQSWMSAFINAHVDIVKDAYISKLNVNPFTYNTVSLLARSGWGDVAIWFLAQPIIRQLSDADNKAKSLFLRNRRRTKSKYSYKKQFQIDVLLNYFDEDDILKIEKQYRSNDESLYELLAQSISFIKNNSDMLEYIATHPNVTTVKNKSGQEYSVADILKQVYFVWLTLDRYSRALSKLVLFTKIDTKKHGKSFIENALYLKGFLDLIFNSDGLFDEDSLHKLMTLSWISMKTRNAISLPRRIMKNQMFSANDGFLKIVDDFCSKIQNGSDFKLLVDDISLISKSLQTAIKSRYIVKYVKQYLKKSDQYITDLFVGNRNMCARLNMLQDQIRNNLKYKRLASNGLIQQLSSEYNNDEIFLFGQFYKSPQFIKINDNVDGNPINTKLLQEGWADLLNDEDIHVRNFARDLIVYAFMTSGEFLGWNKLFKYVPYQWIFGQIDSGFLSFNDYVKEQLYSNCSEFDSTEILDQIVANNYENYNLCQRVKEYDDGKVNYVTSNDRSVLVLSPNEDLNNPRMYITVTNDSGIDEIYKFIQMFVDNKGRYIPIYSKIHKRGYRDHNNNVIYEYGWNFNYIENLEPSALPNTENISDNLFNNIFAYKNGKFYDSLELFAKALNGGLSEDQLNTVTNTKKVPIVTEFAKRGGENIYSGGSDFAKLLTNVGNNVSLEFRGRKYVNSEHAYQTWKSGEFDETAYVKNGGRGTKPVNTDISDELMEEILTEKLKQHPELVDGINERGGLSYLQNSVHVTGSKETHWQSGEGRDNAFIKALIKAYKNVNSSDNNQRTNVKKVSSISEKTEAYGVEISSGSQEFWSKVGDGWQTKHPQGLVAYRKNGDSPKSFSPETVMEGWIGNPFSTQARGENTVQQFYDWIVTGNNFGNERATEEFRQAIIEKIRNTPENSPILYYTELNRPSHATVIGYLVNNKQLLPTINQQDKIQTHSGNWSRQEAQIRESSINDILKILGGVNDNVAAQEVQDALDVLNNGITFDEALSTVNPIFTESEIQQIKSTGKKLLVKSVSRETDPAFFANEIIKFLEENYKKPLNDPKRTVVLELWTKHDGEPILRILKACKKYKVAPMVQFSITTLGDSELEKGVLKYSDLIPLIEKLILNGDLDPRITAIRIDPILVGRTSMSDIEDVVNKCKKLGIKKFITSLVQSYGYLDGTDKDRKVTSGITAATTREGNPYDWEKYYGIVTQKDFEESSEFVKKYQLEHPYAGWGEVVAEGVKRKIRVVTRSSIGKIHFIPKAQYIDEVGAVLKRLNEDPSIKIETCSFFIDGLHYSACLDPLIIERVTGINVTRPDGTYDRDTSRPECMCYGVHGDMFRKNEKRCYSSCAYCYAAHSGDDYVEYYNEDGSIKDRPLTRVKTEGKTVSLTDNDLEKAKEIKKKCKGE